MSIKLMLGDCLELMKEIPDASVDMVLCDLPYGTTQNKWDSVIPLDLLWSEYRRVCKGAVVLTAMQPFSSLLVSSCLKNFRHEWIWHKNKASGHLNAKRAPMRAHESILVFSLGPVPYQPRMTTGHKPSNYAMRASQSSNYGQAKSTAYGGQTERYPRSVQDWDVVNNDDPSRFHPTQKPVEMMEYLIRTYTHEGMTVLDNCMGSGTTGVACVNTGRNFIGIEMDEDYFHAAQNRIGAACQN